MKILWVSHLVPYPPKAGVLIRSYNLVRELGSRHDVDLFMFNQEDLLGSYFSTQESGLEAARLALAPYVKRQWVHQIPSYSSKLNRLWLITRSFFSFVPYTINWLKSDVVESKLREIVLEGGYDLIHFDTISLDVFRHVLNDGPKLVLDHHNIESHMMGRRARNELNWLKKIYFTWEYNKLAQYERNNLSNYDGHIVCSEDDRSRLLELNSHLMVEVIPNGIEFGSVLPERKIQKGKLLFIGGLSWYPNRDAIINFIDLIYPELVSEGVSFSLDIIGKSPPAQLVDAISEIGDITFHGFVDDISGYYEEANVYICPITDGGGTKLKILDAFAKKMAVVAYPVACEGIDVKHGRDILIANNPKEFSDCIIMLMEDLALCERLGEASFTLVKQKYSYDFIGQALSQFYEGICSDSPKSGL
jgi:glycosyltransferase involved in cell wall biosynthesis